MPLMGSSVDCTARERIPELSSIETSQTEKPRGKKKGTD